ALGARAGQLQAALSDSLAGWLAEVSRARRDAIDAAHLFEILRAELGLEVSGPALDELDGEAMRRAPRMVVGGSRVQLPHRPFHLWMPSMNAGLVKRMKE
ncbi:MAG TPA: hypothetical protein VF723_12270, partial [Pyrinomonadaceae bacterium]